MNANELRIGDYVKFPTGSFYKVDMLYDDFSSLLYWMPIPLTEELLLKFGATNLKDKIVFDRFMLTYFESYKYWYVTDLKTNCYLTKVEFVHEWQNFVFVMNGTELTLKP